MGNRGAEKVFLFFRSPKIKGPIFFQNSKQKWKKIIYRTCPKIKGAEFGEGGRKLEGPKIKGSKVKKVLTLQCE